MYYHPENDHRPDGQWRIYEPTFDIAGVQYHRINVIQFINAVVNSDKNGWPFGLRIIWDTENPHSKTGRALSVYGFASEKSGLFFRSQKKVDWHLGYVPSGFVGREVGIHTPISGEIYSVYQGDNGYVNVTVKLLLPSARSGYWANGRHPWKNR